MKKVFSFIMTNSKKIWHSFWNVENRINNDTKRQFRAVLLLRVASVVIIFINLRFRIELPDWMLDSFKSVFYILFVFNLLLLIFYKPVADLLVRRKYLITVDLVISVGLLLIGAGWRSSYFSYTFTTIIIFAIFGKIKGNAIATFILMIVSLLKNPYEGGDELAFIIFDTSTLDMRIGACNFYLIAGVIIGYFKFLLDKISILRNEKIMEIKKSAVIEQRMKLALDIHDNIKSKIQAIILHHKPLIKTLLVQDTEYKQDILRLWKWLSYVQKDTLRLFHSLKKEDLFFPEDKEGQIDLIKFIDEEINAFSDVTSFSWNLEYTEKDFFIELSKKQSLLQFLNEAMINSWKHSGVNKGTIKLFKSKKKKQITIRDYGKGFNIKTVKKNRYSGLMSMKLRAEELGGNLEIISIPGNGCTLIITFP